MQYIYSKPSPPAWSKLTCALVLRDVSASNIDQWNPNFIIYQYGLSIWSCTSQSMWVGSRVGEFCGIFFFWGELTDVLVERWVLIGTVALWDFELGVTEWGVRVGISHCSAPLTCSCTSWGWASKQSVSQCLNPACSPIPTCHSWLSCCFLLH